MFSWVIFKKSRRSWRKAAQLMGSEWLSHAIRSLILDTTALLQILPYGLFSSLHKQFSWWENMPTSGYLKAACQGQRLCLSIVWTCYCSWVVLLSFYQDYKLCNHVVKQIFIGSETIFSKWCCNDWQLVTFLHCWGVHSWNHRHSTELISSVKQTLNLSDRESLCSWATECKSFE